MKWIISPNLYLEFSLLSLPLPSPSASFFSELTFLLSSSSPVTMTNAMTEQRRKQRESRASHEVGWTNEWGTGNKSAGEKRVCTGALYQGSTI